MEYIIRKMKKSDCSFVTHVITVAWNETYRGIVSDKILDNMYLNEDERTNKAYNRFNEKDNHQFVLEVNKMIVGYMNVGPTDDAEYNNCGEVHAIYIINNYKGKGYGRRMIEVGIAELKKMGFDKMIIGCLVNNSSNEFYKHIGGIYIKQRMFKKLGLLENVYYFENI